MVDAIGSVFSVTQNVPTDAKVTFNHTISTTFSQGQTTRVAADSIHSATGFVHLTDPLCAFEFSAFPFAKARRVAQRPCQSREGLGGHSRASHPQLERELSRWQGQRCCGSLRGYV